MINNYTKIMCSCGGKTTVYVFTPLSGVMNNFYYTIECVNCGKVIIKFDNEKDLTDYLATKEKENEVV